MISGAVIMAACTDSKPGVVSGPGPTTNPTGVPTTTSTGGTVTEDGGPVPDGSATGTADPTVVCGAVKFGNSAVEELADAPDVTPPTGGTITPGRYVLSSIIGVAPPDAGGPTGYYARKAILFTADGTFAFLQAEGNTTDGVGETVLTGGTFTVDGTNLVTKTYCPDNTGAVVTYPFSASGARVALLRGSRWEVYQKK